MTGGRGQVLSFLHPGCILTTALLMQALNPRENFAEISAYLGKLCTVDPYRAAYYRDLREFCYKRNMKTWQPDLVVPE